MEAAGVFLEHGPSNLSIFCDDSPYYGRRVMDRKCVLCDIPLSWYIWVRSQNCGRLVTWFCYQLIAKPGKKTATVSWPDPYAMWAQLIDAMIKTQLRFNLLWGYLISYMRNRFWKTGNFTIPYQLFQKIPLKNAINEGWLYTLLSLIHQLHCNDNITMLSF